MKAATGKTLARQEAARARRWGTTFCAWLLASLLVGTIWAQVPNDAPCEASRATALPSGLPPLGPLSTWGFEGAAGEPGPIFYSGDGCLQVRYGGSQAGTIRLRSWAGDLPPCELDLRLLRDGDECDLDRVHLRRVRASDGIVWERDDRDGLRLRFAGAVSQGALWIWCEATEECARPGEPLLLLPEVTSSSWSVACAAVGTAKTSPSWAIRIGPRRREATADLAHEVSQVLVQAAARWRSGTRLRIDSSAPEVDDFVRDALAQLAACCDADGCIRDEQDVPLPTAERTGPLLALLRFCEATPASALLAPAPPLPHPLAQLEAMCWNVIHHGWYLRATHDSEPVRRHAEHLAEAAGSIEAALQTEQPFPQEILAVQALGTMGSLADTMDRIGRPDAWRRGPPPDRAGAPWTQRSLQALHRLEERHWRIAEERFGPRTLAAAALLPCATGQLLATGDRIERHVRAVLRGLGRDGDRCLDHLDTTTTSPIAQIYTVSALTQFAARERRNSLQRLLTMAGPAASFEVRRQLDHNTTGWAIDTALYALTGHRIAIGPGIDEEWLRLSPCLPVSPGRLAVCGLTQDGCRTDLWLDGGTDAPPTHDESRDPFVQTPLLPGQAWTRLTVHLHSAPGSERRIVASCQGQQLQAVLRTGESFTHALQDAAAPAWLGNR